MRVYLLGYMGCGKSTLGRILGEELGMQFIDLDDEIEAKYKMTITDFFSTYGEEAFRLVEHKLLMEISKLEDVIISTGGGTPCFFDNLKHMSETGITIYLKATPYLLLERIRKSHTKRPLFLKMKGDEALQQITNHLEGRLTYYNQAQVIIDAENPDIKSIIDHIRKII